MVTNAAENYLREIYGLLEQADHDQVSMGRLAETMGVAPGTATAMVKRLADHGQITYEPYAGVRLTEDGRRAALGLIRRHRLIEIFLVEMLGFDWSEIHDEARLLEHAVSNRLLDRIDSLLGHPAVDPHGDPVPDADGHIRPSPDSSLWHMQPDQRVRVVRVLDQAPAFLRYLADHGLRPGSCVRIVARDQAGEVVTVQSFSGVSVTLGAGVAEKLLVEPSGE